MVSTIRKEAERASAIVGRLLAFAHPSREEFCRVDLQELASSVGTLLGPVLEKSGVEFRSSAENLTESPGGVVIEADPSQIQQIMVNLLLNASQATGPGGWVSLEVLDAEGPNPEDWPGFRVCDNGPGIAPEIEDRLFDPFFTTKEVGEGTGLGLSVCYGILRDHGGKLILRNRPEGGAEALVRLPLATMKDLQ
jgi:signal transduction histidine kinase